MAEDYNNTPDHCIVLMTKPFLIPLPFNDFTGVWIDFVYGIVLGEFI